MHGHLAGGVVTRLAADWPEWASECEAGTALQPEAQPVTEFTLTASMGGRDLFSQRVDVQTGEPLQADVLPFRRP